MRVPAAARAPVPAAGALPTPLPATSPAPVPWGPPVVPAAARSPGLTYQRRPSALHAARAWLGAAYCAALAGVALVAVHPLVLAADVGAILLAGALAGVGPRLITVMRFGVGFALLCVAINPLVSHNGLTVVARGPVLPLAGELDVTLEALVAGALIGLRLLAVFLAAGLYSVAVDPDELLRGMRRVSSRSALAATLSVRLWPTLRRDGHRLAEARRALHGGRPPGRRDRLGLLRALITGALERAVDVAATLELRGYAGAARPPRRRTPWSRHDVAIALGTLGLLALAAVQLAGVARFHAYPRLAGASALATAPVALAVVALAGAPLLSRRGVAP